MWTTLETLSIGHSSPSGSHRWGRMAGGLDWTLSMTAWMMPMLGMS